MKNFFVLMAMMSSTFVFADNIQIPCTFKEDGNTQSFNLTGSRDASGGFTSSGNVSDVSVNFNYSRGVGRTIEVSYGGSTNTLSLSGTGKMSYPPGGLGGLALRSMGMGSDRKLKVVCDPDKMIVIQAPKPVVVAPDIQPIVVVTPVSQPTVATPILQQIVEVSPTTQASVVVAPSSQSNVVVANNQKLDVLIPLSLEAGEIVHFQNGAEVVGSSLVFKDPECAILGGSKIDLQPGQLDIVALRPSYDGIDISVDISGKRMTIICMRMPLEERTLEGALKVIGPANMKLVQEDSSTGPAAADSSNIAIDGSDRALINDSVNETTSAAPTATATSR